MVKRYKKRDISLLESDVKKIISVLRKNFPEWRLENHCSYIFYKKNSDNSAFSLEGNNFADEKDFDRAASILQRKFPHLIFNRSIMYEVGPLSIYVHNIGGRHSIMLRHRSSELDEDITKVLTRATPELGGGYSYDSHNDASKWSLRYINSNNIKLNIM